MLVFVASSQLSSQILVIVRSKNTVNVTVSKAVISTSVSLLLIISLMDNSIASSRVFLFLLPIFSLPSLVSKASRALKTTDEVLSVGETVESSVGEDVGLPVGEDVGLPVGEDVGLPVGEDVGLPVGEDVGLPVGEDVGLSVGEDVGLSVGGDAKGGFVSLQSP